MSFLGLGGFEIVVLLVIALAVVAGLYLVVRAAVTSGAARVGRDEQPRRGEHRD